MTANAKPTVLLDKIFETELGALRILVDFEYVLEDISKYTDRLIMARNLPFDVDNLSPADPMLVTASQLMSWNTDANQVFIAVKQHYENLLKRAQSDATVLAMTKTNKFEFEPQPYPPESESAGDWDISLPNPVRNLNNPIEKRLKQVYDMITSDSSVQHEFLNALNVIVIEADRRSQKVDDDGFQSRRINGTSSKKNGSHRLQPKVSSEPSGLASLSGGDGDSQQDL